MKNCERKTSITMLKYENKNFHNKKKEVVTMKLELKLRKNKKKER